MARLFEVREALEGMAARLAAPRIALTEVRSLRALFHGLDGPPSAAIVRRYIERLEAEAEDARAAEVQAEG